MPDVLNPYIAGSPVTGAEMFFGRKDVFAFVRQTLTGQYRDHIIVLYGQRRTGKTSVLYQISRYLDTRYLCIFIDLHGLALEGLSGFLWELANHIARVLHRHYQIDLPSLNRSNFTTDPRGSFEHEFLNQVWSHIGDRHLLLMLDEAIRLQEQVQAGKLEGEIFEYLRHLMQHYEQLNFLFALGSGLEEMEKEYAFLFNVGLYKKISFLDRDAAMALITQPIKDCYQVDPAASERILQITSGHPYYTQLLCHLLFNRWQHRSMPNVQIDDVDASLDEAVERGLAVLKQVWEESTSGEKAIMAGMGAAMGERNRPVRAKDIHRAWEKYEIGIPERERTQAVRSLIARDVIVGEDKYAFTVDLQRFWLRKYKRLEWVKEEIADAARGSASNDTTAEPITGLRHLRRLVRRGGVRELALWLMPIVLVVIVLGLATRYFFAPQSDLEKWLPLAQQGDSVAQTIVGEIYLTGSGVQPDPARATAWFEKASEQGNSRAQFYLASLYTEGRGVPRDEAKAWYWNCKSQGRSGAICNEPQVAVASLTVDIIEPILTIEDGSPRAKTRSGMERRIVGRVTAPAGLLRFTVNGSEEELDERGYFRVWIPVQRSSVPVTMVAIDKWSKRAALTFILTPEELIRKTRRPALSTIDFGKYYALIIGNQHYRFWPKLATPENDAEETAEVLSKEYGFQTKVLLNATRYDILIALNKLRKNLTEKDNLLIYYAGHGHLDDKGRGYWLPVDGEIDSKANWISTLSITDIINSISARHVLVVADSSYAGALTLSAFDRPEAGTSDKDRDNWLKLISARRSRTVLTSGDLKPVLDSGGGKHSVFAKAFLDVLKENDEVLGGERLYQELSARIAYAAAAVMTAEGPLEQVPQYAPIKYAGHEGGDFVFVPTAN